MSTRYKIRPIVYEDNDPRKIRAAFRADCGGVIVPQPVPETVTAEIETLKALRQEHADLIDKFHTTLRSPDKNHADNYWSKPHQALTETQRWLEDVWARAMSERLCRPPSTSPSAHLLALWVGSGIDLKWHIDKQRDDLWSDLHVHIEGEGLQMASPRRELKLEFTRNATSPVLMTLKDGQESDDQLTIESELARRGVEIIRLQPGQMFYFNQHGLHKSAPASRLDLKMRAGIF